MGKREHAQLERGVINHDAGGVPIICMWDTCDRRGFDVYRYTECRHNGREGCQSAEDRAWQMAGTSAHIRHIFCTMRHRNYFVNATGRNAQESIARTGRAYGNLPVGLRKMIG